MFSLTELLVIVIVALLVLKPNQIIDLYQQSRQAKRKLQGAIEHLGRHDDKSN
tara:strand:+ start:970 stop:1128 length:159 start_codon:yes stop_codon:yes gene_type:complete